MKFLTPVTALLILYVRSVAAAAQGACTLQITKNVPTTYTSCRVLETSTGANFAWSFSNTTYVLNATIYEQPEQAGGWTAWGINEANVPSMAPGNVIACYPDQSGTATVQQFHLSGLAESGVRPGNKLNFTKTACTIDTSTSPPTNYIQFTLQLNQSYEAFSQIYGKGPGVDFSQPNIILRHNPIDNFGQHITITTGAVSDVVAIIDQSLKNTHGTLNAIGWGILLPLGAIFSRYVRPFADPLWFYIHISLQLSGYLLGVAGFGIGLKLWYIAPPGWAYTVHGNLGCAVFAFATAQIVSAMVKPNKLSKVRGYWNVVHHTLGYTTLVLALINIFRGFDILFDYGNWQIVYVVIIVFLGGLAAVLEVVTWVTYPARKAAKLAKEKLPAGKSMDEETELANQAGEGEEGKRP